MRRLLLIAVTTASLAAAAAALVAWTGAERELRNSRAIAFLNGIETAANGELNRLLAPADALAAIAAALPGTGFPVDTGREPIPDGDAHPARDWLLAAVAATPDLVAAQIGFEGASFIGALDLGAARAAWRDETGAPAEAAFATRRILGNIAGRFDDWVFRDETGAEVGRRRIPEPPLDPLGEWFRDANTETTHGAAHAMAPSGQAGITVTVVTLEVPRVVVAFDVGLAPLGARLAALADAAGNGLEAAIVTADGAVAAESGRRVAPAGDGALPMLETLRSPALLAAAELRGNDAEPVAGAVLKVRERKWMATVRRLAARPGAAPLVLIAAVPLAAFDGALPRR